jgi:hypothetical protein
MSQTTPELFTSYLEEGYVESYENGQYVVLEK